MSLTLQEAQEIINTAVEKAQEIEQPMNIAIVDAGNNLLAFARMENAWLGSIDIAQGKAFTARAFDMSTEDLAPMAQPNQSLFGIDASNNSKVIIFAGGIPLQKNGEIVGAIGVSGGSVDQDQVVAEAGAAKIYQR